MKIQILSYEPRQAPDGSPDSYIFSEKRFFPYVVTYLVNGQQYQGEASVMKTPPWWEIGQSYETTITSNANCIGGNKLSIKFPDRESHTGGSKFQSPGANQRQQQFGSPQATVAPQFRQPQTTGPQVSQYHANEGPPPLPEEDQKSNLPTKEDFRQALIVSQTSMKVAVEYVTSLTEPEKLAMQDSLKTEEDLVSKYADKIARETYNLAIGLIAPPE